MRGAWPVLRERVLDSAFLASACLAAPGVRRLVAEFEAGRDAALRPLWRLCALALWRAEFGVTL
jgi:hypothetical protein